MIEFWSDLARFWSDAGANRRLVMLGVTLLGISSGVLGTFALLRKQSLLGDAMAHAALPGVCLAFILTGEKNPLWFLIGASITGFIGAFIVSLITRHSRIKNDTAIGLVLSVFFGAGIVLLTFIQKSSFGNQSGLDTFLFGKAASLLREDLYLIAAMCFSLLLLVTLFYKEFKVVCFDQMFAASIGLPVNSLDILLTILIVFAVMIGLQAVGVVLMVAMLIIPAAAARQWTNSLGKMVIVSASMGAISGIVGAYLSIRISKMPTGPVMVLVASSLLLISIFVAPQRGVLPRHWRKWRNKVRIHRENTLKTLYKIYEDNNNWGQPLPLEEIVEKAVMPAKVIIHYLKDIQKLRWVKRDNNSWILTEQGMKKAKYLIRNHRLWEVYLTQRMDIAADHVHRDAEEIEHILPPDIVEKLEEVLKSPHTDPHGRPIPSLEN